ncbi:hypothetical protein Hanom_Chr11g01044991 [Helianthus anomalus]
MLKKKQDEESALITVKKQLREVFERDDTLLDLKAFNIIVVPMIEKAHFYLICMDLDTGDVKVIDNMDTNRDAVHVKTVTTGTFEVSNVSPYDPNSSLLDFNIVRLKRLVKIVGPRVMRQTVSAQTD